MCLSGLLKPDVSPEERVRESIHHPRVEGSIKKCFWLKKQHRKTGWMFIPTKRKSRKCSERLDETCSRYHQAQSSKTKVKLMHWSKSRNSQHLLTSALQSSWNQWLKSASTAQRTGSAVATLAGIAPNLDLIKTFLRIHLVTYRTLSWLVNSPRSLGCLFIPLFFSLPQHHSNQNTKYLFSCSNAASYFMKNFMQIGQCVESLLFVSLVFISQASITMVPKCCGTVALASSVHHKSGIIILSTFTQPFYINCKEVLARTDY